MTFNPTSFSSLIYTYVTNTQSKVQQFKIHMDGGNQFDMEYEFHHMKKQCEWWNKNANKRYMSFGLFKENKNLWPWSPHITPKLVAFASLRILQTSTNVGCFFGFWSQQLVMQNRKYFGQSLGKGGLISNSFILAWRVTGDSFMRAHH